jgi:hypothetical protein
VTATRAALVAIVCAIGCHRAPPMERAAIGAVCANDKTCGSSPTFHCATDHPGGYCEAECSSDRDCPAEAVCVGGAPLSKGACHQRCNEPAARPCRTSEGYQCIAADEDASHDYCDPPGRSALSRRLRGKAWRW